MHIPEDFSNIKNLKAELESVNEEFNEALELNQRLIDKVKECESQQQHLMQTQYETNNEFEKFTEKIVNTKELMDDLKDYSSKTRQLIGTEFTKLLQGDFKNFKHKMGSLLQDMRYQTMNNLLKNMVIGGYDKNSEGKLGGILGYLSQGLRKSFDPMGMGQNFGGMLKNFLTPRALGGNVANNKPYLVGEYGPELFIPNAAGKIDNRIPKNKPINLTVNISTPNIDSFRKSEQQIIAEITQNLQHLR
ncbi:phage tail tape measure family protein [Rickettsiales endosymbiont of Stachyamoeba lipophora]|uniref:hypothetical protein n=1 Tax=Rickettsiales endosymbiont of Stachyamoeba lipophora TaxID=2486578 RepID=UPI000F651BC7|nr:hypothetical protein [Rickettsiales endosymbiont of Stachyamoeba lipophora]AZL15551.1 hypothetical protein EF513_03160 [Rickettsiales endosymbiont of Stachyamoeba lipophora]